jgi:hypothetical protein
MCRRHVAESFHSEISQQTCCIRKMAASLNVAVLRYTGVVRGSTSGTPARPKRVACLQSNAAGIEAWRSVVCEEMASSRVGGAVMVVKEEVAVVSFARGGGVVVSCA